MWTLRIKPGRIQRHTRTLIPTPNRTQNVFRADNEARGVCALPEKILLLEEY